MKANELRVGNWVEKTEIKYSGLKLYHSEIAINDLIHASSLKPIPLTEEWLLKFGFEKMGDKFSLKNKKAGVFRFVKTSGNIIVGELEHGRNSISEFITYVHQLQNLYFALTGEELTLKNK